MSHRGIMFAYNLSICMKTSVEILGDHSEPEQPTGLNIILSKELAPLESIVAVIRFPDIKNNFRFLIIENDKGQSACFLWQQNIISSPSETGYFKEVMNDLGVTVHHSADSITIINGGIKQFLNAKLDR